MDSNNGLSDLLIRGGRVIDPANGRDGLADVLARDGRVAAVGPRLVAPGAAVLDATGLVVAPGFVDLHAHLREPGFEHKETVATGTRAAARGGFTTVCAMPNTSPPADTRSTVEFVLRMAAGCDARVLPLGAISKGRAGRELAEMADLAEAGAVAFSDDGECLGDAALMRSALSYATMLGRAVVQHAENAALSGRAPAHEGWVATRLGLRGQPSAAEESIVARDIELAALTGARLHLAHLSTAGAVEQVRRAKERGLSVTAEVTPHHLTLTHEALLGGELGPYDTNTKVNPPLRTPDDVAALRAALRDGVVDAIATDHAPHAIEDKLCEYDAAAFGITGLETAFALSMTLAHAGDVPLSRLIEALTIGPVRALRLDELAGLPGLGTLAEGAPADIVVLDPDAEWVVDPAAFASKGKNTPLAGRTLRGRVIATVYGGRVVHEAREVQV